AGGRLIDRAVGDGQYITGGPAFLDHADELAGFQDLLGVGAFDAHLQRTGSAHEAGVFEAQRAGVIGDRTVLEHDAEFASAVREINLVREERGFFAQVLAFADAEGNVDRADARDAGEEAVRAVVNERPDIFRRRANDAGHRRLDFGIR